MPIRTDEDEITVIPEIQLSLGTSTPPPPGEFATALAADAHSLVPRRGARRGEGFTPLPGY